MATKHIFVCDLCKKEIPYTSNEIEYCAIDVHIRHFKDGWQKNNQTDRREVCIECGLTYGFILKIETKDQIEQIKIKNYPEVFYEIIQQMVREEISKENYDKTNSQI